jgi:hypothetical protein
MNVVRVSRGVCRAVVCAVCLALLCTATLGALEPTGEDAAVSQVVVPPPAMAARLPQPGGDLPLLAVTAVLCLGFGFSLRRLWAR